MSRLYDDTWKEVPCDIWPGPLFIDGGYGKTPTGERAHVVAYREHIGPIELGLIIMHKCDTPACREPRHLLKGTKADNTRDMMDKGRGRNGKENLTHCKRNHPLSGDNLYRYKNRRICRECMRQANKLQRRRVKHDQE